MSSAMARLLNMEADQIYARRGLWRILCSECKELNHYHDIVCKAGEIIDLICYRCESVLHVQIDTDVNLIKENEEC